MEKLDLVSLLMPGGKIPLPEVVPPGARTAGNLFDMRSRKLGRDLLLDSELEWLNAKRIEADPNVLWFCEHYPRIKVWVETRWKTTIFDMLVCYQDYSFKLMEVKYVADSNPQPGTDIWWQLRAQKIWCEQHKVPYDIVDEQKICRNPLELKNIKKILGLLCEIPAEKVCLAVLESLPNETTKLMRDIIYCLSFYDEDDVIRSICSLILKGTLQAPIDRYEFNKSIPITRY